MTTGTSNTNDIIELRGHLFDTLRSLKDKTAPMDIDRAKAVSDVAQTIINSAKVECDFIKATGNDCTSNFIQRLAPKPGTPAPPAAELIEQRPGLRVTKHTLKG